jgi:shikimate dehydrogenase
VQLSGRTQLAAVIGAPVTHSLSPAILNAAFAAADLDWAFLAFEVAPDRVAAALDGVRALGIRGLSVTMPHKEAVAALVDRASDDALALGAVNCVVHENGALVGHNTDGPGFVDALRAETGLDVAGRRVVLVGAGGAARAIALALGRAGAADVAVVNRTPARAEVAAALAGAAGRVGDASDVESADLVVNATPVGMLDAALPVAADLIHPGQVVADIVYHPSTTPLLAAAAEREAACINGLGMLVHQAAHAFRLWTGREPPISAMRSGAEGQLSQLD